MGRIAEVGQVKNTNAAEPVTSGLTRNNTNLQGWLTARDAVRGQVTQTVYDLKYAGFIGSEASLVYQANLRNRVSCTAYTDTASLSGYNQATFYSYDIDGNVDTLLQDYGNSTLSGVTNTMNIQSTMANRWKRLVYNYDLISGKVNMVAYQPPRGTLYYGDMFYHRYSYDAENRLVLTETSMDSSIWEKDARYEYYRHGPLARTTLGEQLVQGTDYAYTLQGWLKGVNAVSLSDANNDMGFDGKVGAPHQFTARDAMGFQLDYFAFDYRPIYASVYPFPPGLYTIGNYWPGEDSNLYNGNITGMTVNIKFPSPTAVQDPQYYNYKYDQLNRITGMDVYRGLNQTSNSWQLMALKTDYKERVSYDANGNILKYLRNATASPNINMDSLTYNYYPNTNRLKYVRDNVAAANYTDDIDDQTNQSNYGYDEIGNLRSDAAEGISEIKWNVYGKIKEIARTATASNTVTNIKYTYDASGQRISKTVFRSAADSIEYTWYVRDASGNVMSTYLAKGPGSGTISIATNSFTLIEQPLYGSSRLGIFNRNLSLKTTFTEPLIGNFMRGSKAYELSNHLGNVLATISDKKLGHDAGNGTIDYYNADIVTANDYYPFGMLMPGRKYSAVGSGYRYGFNGKENDKDISGGGQDYGLRIYDNRLGRFLSVDPLIKDYPYYTPYQFAGNSPIELIDIDGGEGGKIVQYLKDFSDAVSDWFTFKDEIEDVKLGTQDIATGMNQQIVGPWNAWKYASEANPELAIAKTKADGYITGLRGTAEVLSGVQGAGNKVRTIVEIPLIIKDLSSSVIKKTTSTATSKVMRPVVEPTSTSSYKISDNVSEWPGPTPNNVKPPVNKIGSPNFIVDGSGQAFPVPKGATGPTPVINPTGKQTGVAFTGGKGGKNGKVSTMRIMNPTPAKGGSPGYPNGYIKYENSATPKPQGVNPSSGQTAPNSQSHYPINSPFKNQ